MQSQTHAYSIARLIPFVTKHNEEPMNIIFDLSGVLFNANASKPCSIQNKLACALRPINPAASIRLLHDCIQNGHRLFVVSNLPVASFEFLMADPQAARLFNYFEDIVLSDKVGIQKPDPRIFSYLLEKHKLDPRNSVFIDDEKVNLEAAHKAGITKGIHCLNFNFGAVRSQLEVHGVL